MKCPKCGYLGFETTDRCRNCQYDFSLSAHAGEPELQLHDPDRHEIGVEDLDLLSAPRPADTGAPATLDLDRLFGAEEPAAAPAPAASRRQTPPPAPDPVEGPDDSALPFDESPLPAPPRAARAPLGVRRTTPEVPRNRPRTTRPVRMESALAFDAEPTPPDDEPSADDALASGALEMPPIGTRVAAGLIDVALLGAIDFLVLFLTLRIAGLQSTLTDVRTVLSPPLFGFFGLLAFGYVAAFTVAGGQTIGKMVCRLRVIGDDGRPVDAAGGVLRAAGSMLVPATLGLSYLPALITADQRAVHDRLAGTRVVRE